MAGAAAFGSCLELQPAVHRSTSILVLRLRPSGEHYLVISLSTRYSSCSNCKGGVCPIVFAVECLTGARTHCNFNRVVDCNCCRKDTQLIKVQPGDGRLIFSNVLGEDVFDTEVGRPLSHNAGTFATSRPARCFDWMRGVTQGSALGSLPASQEFEVRLSALSPCHCPNVASVASVQGLQLLLRRTT
jgi:hypothetical protein